MIVPSKARDVNLQAQDADARMQLDAHDKSRQDRQPKFFAVQVAVTKASGGLETLICHYADMFRQNGIPSMCAYRGPAWEHLLAHNVDLVAMPWALTSPLGAYVGRDPAFERLVRTRSNGAALLFVVHSDRALAAIRRLFPDARIVASCHSDKYKRKGIADLVITGNQQQQDYVAVALAGTGAKVAKLGNPFASTVEPIGATRERATIGSRIVFCARFTAVKSPMTLVNSIDFIRRRPLPEFLFIGDGPQASELRRAAESKPARITFAGWKTKPWEEFRPGDVLVLPSTFEALPYLLLEALAREVPVIASDIPGNSEALGQGEFGQLFSVGDPHALAACIDRIGREPDRFTDMATAGRASVLERFGSPNFWKAMQSVMG